MSEIRTLAEAGIVLTPSGKSGVDEAKKVATNYIEDIMEDDEIIGAKIKTPTLSFENDNALDIIQTGPEAGIHIKNNNEKIAKFTGNEVELGSSFFGIDNKTVIKMCDESIQITARKGDPLYYEEQNGNYFSIEAKKDDFEVPSKNFQLVSSYDDTERVIYEFELTETEPWDWADAWKKYFTKTGNVYERVVDYVCPVWEANKYYEPSDWHVIGSKQKAAVSVYATNEKYMLLTHKPDDWDQKWHNYFFYQDDQYQRILDYAPPVWESNKYYEREDYYVTSGLYADNEIEKWDDYYTSDVYTNVSYAQVVTEGNGDITLEAVHNTGEDGGLPEPGDVIVNGHSLIPSWKFTDSDRRGVLTIMGIRFEWGYAAATPSGSGDVRTGTVNVNFSEEYVVRPIVMTSLSNAATNAVVRVAVTSGNIRTDGFTATVLRGSNTETQFFWLAIGPSDAIHLPGGTY